ncbi:HigA family addiction module antitoxin [Celerinatantimonas yamalensis]|uniref:HigA family addiction module antitoxin n=1 Tax=Celerinatantimonas yamalensis TaxID=559956 RepID=A0ABW9G7P9_9GAMM
MTMSNPPHPGEFIESVYMTPHNISCRMLATHLGVSPSTLNRVINGKSGISPRMALRLSKTLGRSPESWMTIQDNYDLWCAKQALNLNHVQPIALDLV